MTTAFPVVVSRGGTVVQGPSRLAHCAGRTRDGAGPCVHPSGRREVPPIDLGAGSYPVPGLRLIQRAARQGAAGLPDGCTRCLVYSNEPRASTPECGALPVPSVALCAASFAAKLAGRRVSPRRADPEVLVLGWRHCSGVGDGCERSPAQPLEGRRSGLHGVPREGYSQTTPSPSARTGECRIKGNIGRNGARIYHVPGARHYDRTRIDTSKGERWFCFGGAGAGGGVETGEAVNQPFRVFPVPPRRVACSPILAWGWPPGAMPTRFAPASLEVKSRVRFPRGIGRCARSRW